MGAQASTLTASQQVDGVKAQYDRELMLLATTDATIYAILHQSSRERLSYARTMRLIVEQLAREKADLKRQILELVATRPPVSFNVQEVQKCG